MTKMYTRTFTFFHQMFITFVKRNNGALFTYPVAFWGISFEQELRRIIYIYAFIRLQIQAIHIFCQYVCSLGIEPTTFCAANAMLYH